MKFYTGTTRAFSENSDRVRITTKITDVISNPSINVILKLILYLGNVFLSGVIVRLTAPKSS